MDFYQIEICGVHRSLPLIQVGRNTKIASFSILGDVELVDCLADEMTRRIVKLNFSFDYIVGPEVKSVPLIHGVAKRLGHKKFIVCRKSIKPYMLAPVRVNPLSHFPKHAKPLAIDGQDAKLLKDKRVLIIDDVISSGVTMRMMKYLIEKLGAEVVGIMVAIKQGKQLDIFPNLHYIQELPVFDTHKDG